MPTNEAESVAKVRDPLRDAIATEVRAEVGRQQVSQRDIGAILDLPQASIHQRLKGDIPWRAEELVKLAVAFGVPPERFLPVPVAAPASAA